MNTTNQDEIHMTTPELITAHGYKSETHHIWTEDEYCLDIHRVLPKSYQNSTYNLLHNKFKIYMEVVKSQQKDLYLFSFIMDYYQVQLIGYYWVQRKL